jgi:hypothetical protein
MMVGVCFSLWEKVCLLTRFRRQNKNARRQRILLSLSQIITAAFAIHYFLTLSFFDLFSEQVGRNRQGEGEIAGTEMRRIKLTD